MTGARPDFWNASCFVPSEMRGGTRALALFAGISFFAGDLAAQDRPYSAGAPGQSLAAAADPLEVEVHITSNKPGTFFGRADAVTGRRRAVLVHPDPWQAESWVYPGAVCRAPCSARVSIIDNPYRLAAVFQAPSGRLDLFPSSRGLDIRVHFGSLPGYIFGTVFTALGAVFTAAGAASLATWAALGEPSSTANNTPGALRPVGTAFVLIGLPSLAIGLPLFLTQRTTVEVVERSETKEARSSPVRWNGQGFSF
jgi:hypothetical protein